MTLVLLIEEDAQNELDWASVDGLDSTINSAHALVAKSFDALEEVAVMLTSNSHIQQLNADFREKDKPTNVLSFPDEDAARLGDIAIAFSTMKEEAIAANISLQHHLSHMVVHGLLHLLGYDHENDADAEEMEALETDLLAQLNIADPYR